jgi:hypothetical protein
MNALKVMLAKKNREVNPESWEQLYESLIIRKIRKRYTVNQELAILRQRDSKPVEFEAYNEYVERCKAEVKEELGIN